MAKVIIFGIQSNAELAYYYLKNDSEHELVAFCVDAKYVPETPLKLGLPVVAFEEVEKHYSPDEYRFIAPLTASNMNKDRELIYQRIKQKAYSFISYISSKATILSDQIGENCFILEDNTVQPYTVIGDNVILWSGNHIGHHSKIASHVFISSHVVISGHCIINEYSFLGVNSTLRDGLNIAEGSFIAMASSVTKDTEVWQAYAGNPAKALGKKSTEINIYHANS